MAYELLEVIDRQRIEYIPFRINRGDLALNIIVYKKIPVMDKIFNFFVLEESVNYFLQELDNLDKIIIYTDKKYIINSYTNGNCFRVDLSRVNLLRIHEDCVFIDHKNIIAVINNVFMGGESLGEDVLGVTDLLNIKIKE